jgi:hypothetical protein
MLKKLLVGSLLLGSTALLADQASIGINSDSIKLGFKKENVDSQYTKVEPFFSFTSTEKDDLDLNKVDLGVNFTNYEVSGKLKPYIGLKVTSLKLEKSDAQVSLPLTGGLVLEHSDKLNMGVDLSAAPKVLAFNDLDSYYGYALYASYKIIDNGSVKITYEDDTFEYDNGSKLEKNNLLFGYSVLF